MAVSCLHAAELTKSSDIPNLTSTYSIWKVVASLVFIIAFIPASLWLVKKLQFTQMKFNKSEIRIVSTQSLGAKEKLILVEVEGERVLIGATAHSINHIKSFSSNSKQFAQLMSETAQQQPSEGSPPEPNSSELNTSERASLDAEKSSASRGRSL